jgi:predicted HAD superfamily Cof-like phosphohydrolase
MNGASLIQGDVSRFMQGMGQTVRGYPQNINDVERKLRIDLITEEFDETIAALVELGAQGHKPDLERFFLAEVADGVADLIYVAVGTTLALGIDLTDVWEAVQKANMKKAYGPVRQDGKRLKPKDWVAPDVEGIIRNQQLEGMM